MPETNPLPDRSTLGHAEVCELVRAHVEAQGKSTLWIGNGARAAEYGYALDHDLITEAQYYAGKDLYGRLWNYAGD